MVGKAESKVTRFYDACWSEVNSLDDPRTANKSYSQWEDLRDCAREYLKLCRSRLLRHLPQSGNAMLDAGSGPILYQEYIDYSKNFAKRYCIDLSGVALEEAEKKIGDRGVYLRGNLLDVPLENDFFDGTISVLTIFNIHADEQEKAVRRLLRVTKPGAPVIVVYCNADTLSSRIADWFAERRRHAKLSRQARSRRVRPSKDGSNLYYHRHPVSWWSRFEDIADVEILPWIFLDPLVQKAVVPDNKLGRGMLKLLYKIEDRYPGFFGRNAAYSMIVLRKKVH